MPNPLNNMAMSVDALENSFNDLNTKIKDTNKIWFEQSDVMQKLAREGKTLNTTVSELYRQMSSGEKISRDIVKTYGQMYRALDELEKREKKLADTMKVLNFMSKSTGDQLKTVTASLIKAAASMTNTIAGVTGMTLGYAHLVSTLQNYNRTMFETTRTAKMYGESSARVASEIEKFSQKTTLSKQAAAELNKMFKETTVGIPPTTKAVRELAEAMTGKLGYAQDKVIEGMQKIQQLQSTMPDVWERSIDVINAYSRSSLEGEAAVAGLYSTLRSLGVGVQEINDLMSKIGPVSKASNEYMKFEKVIANSQKTVRNAELGLSQGLQFTLENVAKSMGFVSEKAAGVNSTVLNLTGSILLLNAAATALNVAGLWRMGSLLKKGAQLGGLGTAAAAGTATTAATGTSIGAKLLSGGGKALKIGGYAAAAVGAYIVLDAIYHRLNKNKDVSADRKDVEGGVGDELQDQLKTTEKIGDAARQVKGVYAGIASGVMTTNAVLERQRVLSENQARVAGRYLQDVTEGVKALAEAGLGIGGLQHYANIQVGLDRASMDEFKKTLVMEIISAYQKAGNIKGAASLQKQLAATGPISILGNLPQARKKLESMMDEANEIQKQADAPENAKKRVELEQKALAIRANYLAMVDALGSADIKYSNQAVRSQENLHKTQLLSYTDRMFREEQLLNVQKAELELSKEANLGMGPSFEATVRVVDTLQKKINLTKTAMENISGGKIFEETIRGMAAELDLLPEQLKSVMQGKLKDEALRGYEGVKEKLAEALKIDPASAGLEKAMTRMNLLSTQYLKTQGDITNLTKEQLGYVRQMREGYLDAMKEAVRNAGSFGVILGGINQGVTQMFRAGAPNTFRGGSMAPVTPSDRSAIAPGYNAMTGMRGSFGVQTTARVVGAETEKWITDRAAATKEKGGISYPLTGDSNVGIQTGAGAEPYRAKGSSGGRIQNPVTGGVNYPTRAKNMIVPEWNTSPPPGMTRASGGEVAGGSYVVNAEATAANMGLLAGLGSSFVSGGTSGVDSVPYGSGGQQYMMMPGEAIVPPRNASAGAAINSMAEGGKIIRMDNGGGVWEPSFTKSEYDAIPQSQKDHIRDIFFKDKTPARGTKAVDEKMGRIVERWLKSGSKNSRDYYKVKAAEDMAETESRIAANISNKAARAKVPAQVGITKPLISSPELRSAIKEANKAEISREAEDIAAKAADRGIKKTAAREAIKQTEKTAAATIKRAGLPKRLTKGLVGTAIGLGAEYGGEYVAGKAEEHEEWSPLRRRLTYIGGKITARAGESGGMAAGVSPFTGPLAPVTIAGGTAIGAVAGAYEGAVGFKTMEYKEKWQKEKIRLQGMMAEAQARKVIKDAHLAQAEATKQYDAQLAAKYNSGMENIIRNDPSLKPWESELMAAATRGGEGSYSDEILREHNDIRSGKIKDLGSHMPTVEELGGADGKGKYTVPPKKEFGGGMRAAHRIVEKIKKERSDAVLAQKAEAQQRYRQLHYVKGRIGLGEGRAYDVADEPVRPRPSGGIGGGFTPVRKAPGVYKTGAEGKSERMESVEPYYSPRYQQSPQYFGSSVSQPNVAAAKPVQPGVRAAAHYESQRKMYQERAVAQSKQAARTRPVISGVKPQGRHNRVHIAGFTPMSEGGWVGMPSSYAIGLAGGGAVGDNGYSMPSSFSLPGTMVASAPVSASSMKLELNPEVADLLRIQRRGNSSSGTRTM